MIASDNLQAYVGNPFNMPKAPHITVIDNAYDKYFALLYNLYTYYETIYLDCETLWPARSSWWGGQQVDRQLQLRYT